MNNYEAFVYKWTKTDGFWYIGFHKGSIDDGYISSGEYFLEDYNKNPDLWTREILATGTISEMYDYETKLLQESNAKDDSMSYNKHNNNFPYVANDPEIRAKQSDSMKEFHRNNPDKHVSKRPEVRAKISESMKEYLRNNPEVRAKMSESMKEYLRNNPEVRAKFLGDKNPMKRLEVRAKMSESMKEYLRNNPDKHPMKRPEVIAKANASRKKTLQMKKANQSNLQNFFE